MLQHLQYYMTADIKDITGNCTYPVGLLGEKIHLHFIHYKTFKDAIQAWKRRVARINYDHLYIVMVMRDGCTKEQAHQFASLPYRHKLILTHIPCPDIKCSFCISGFENSEELGNIIDSMNTFGYTYYDQYNWLRFMGCKEEKNTGIKTQ